MFRTINYSFNPIIEPRSNGFLYHSRNIWTYYRNITAQKYYNILYYRVEGLYPMNHHDGLDAGAGDLRSFYLSLALGQDFFVTMESGPLLGLFVITTMAHLVLA